jgi:hypothetical protein
MFSNPIEIPLDPSFNGDRLKFKFLPINYSFNC